MPQSPEERRRTFDRLAEKRTELLQQERERQAQRAEEQARATSLQQQAVRAEAEATAARSTEREAWRQGQHAAKEASLEAARLLAEEQARHAAKQAEIAEEKKEQDARMHALHERASTQKLTARKLQDEHIEEEAVARLRTKLDQDLRSEDDILERTLAHLERERRKHLAQIESDREREVRSLAVKHPEAFAYKRTLLTLDEHAAARRVTVESEHARLKDEATSHCEQKKSHLRSVLNQRLGEAHARREQADAWAETHRS